MHGRIVYGRIKSFRFPYKTIAGTGILVIGYDFYLSSHVAVVIYRSGNHFTQTCFHRVNRRADDIIGLRELLVYEFLSSGRVNVREIIPRSELVFNLRIVGMDLPDTRVHHMRIS